MKIFPREVFVLENRLSKHLSFRRISDVDLAEPMCHGCWVFVCYMCACTLICSFVPGFFSLLICVFICSSLYLLVRYFLCTCWLICVFVFLLLAVGCFSECSLISDCVFVTSCEYFFDLVLMRGCSVCYIM